AREEAGPGPHGEAGDGAAGRGVPGEEIAQPVGQREHPLAHGHVRQDVVDEVCRLLRHAAAATTRTEAPPFARERDEPFVRAALAAHAGEATGEDATGEELAELALDEAGKTAAVGAVGDLAQARFQVAGGL